jgi:coproporphyrinogen III oxidase-like Fe-S oxidoreductase
MLEVPDRLTDPMPEVVAELPLWRWEIANSGLLISALRRSTAPLSIYIHITSRWHHVADSYIENVIAEMELLTVAHGRVVHQMHCGGSAAYLDSRQRKDLFETVTTHFNIAFSADISLGLKTAASDTSHPGSIQYRPLPGTDLIGFGLGAVSHVSNTFTQNFTELEAYEDAIAADRLPLCRGSLRGKRQ